MRSFGLAAAFAALALVALASGATCGSPQIGKSASGSPLYTLTVGGAGVDAAAVLGYRVAAHGLGGAEGASTAGETPTVPNRPTGLAIAAVNASAIRILWEAPAFGVASPDVSGYNVYRNGTLVRQTPASSRSYDDAGVAPAGTTVYRYAVAALNSFGEGPASDPIVTSDPPAPPTSVLATMLNASSVSITWTPPTYTRVHFTGYEILVEGPTIANYTVRAASPPTVLSGFTSGTTYGFRVRTVNGQGKSVATSPPAYAPPWFPQITSLVVVDANTMRVSWDPMINYGPRTSQYLVYDGAFKVCELSV